MESMCKWRGWPLNRSRRIRSLSAARHTSTAGPGRDAAMSPLKTALRGKAAGLQHSKKALVRGGGEVELGRGGADAGVGRHCTWSM